MNIVASLQLHIVFLKVISNLEQKITDQQKEIEDCQNELRILPEITQDTKYLSCQVWTLRRLLSGKDEIIRKQLNQVLPSTHSSIL